MSGAPSVSVVVISRDEPALEDTLATAGEQAHAYPGEAEVVVVDASDGRLDDIRDRHPHVRWVRFERPAGVRVSIPHQRNAGVLASRGRTIVFVDAGCSAQPGWLERLLAPLNGEGEAVVAGVAPNLGSDGLYDADIWERARSPYLPECPTINLAFRRYVYDIVHGFDETFEYGSDIDFSWRVVDAGFRIRSAPDAVVAHDWGGFKRQLKRAYAYGKARVRLYRKHRSRLWRAWRTDPMVLVYPAFLLGLPLTLRFPLYPALLVIPAARARGQGVGRVLADHLAYGAGALVELTRR